MVKADELMRSLGRPNREQVVTTRSDTLTTLEALDLSNGQVFNDLLAGGAASLLNSKPKATADELIDSDLPEGAGAAAHGRRTDGGR